MEGKYENEVEYNKGLIEFLVPNLYLIMAIVPRRRKCEE